jgi:adenylate kinase
MICAAEFPTIPDGKVSALNMKRTMRATRGSKATGGSPVEPYVDLPSGIRTIVFTGVKGAGKSTLASEVGSDLGLSAINYSDLLLEVTGLERKDALDQLSDAERLDAIQRVQQLLEHRWADDSAVDQLLLLTNHLSVISDGVIWTPDRNVHACLRMIALCVVFASPLEILQRRKNGSTADIAHALSEIDEQQKVNAIEAHAVADIYQVPLALFRNASGAPPKREALAWVTGLLQARRRGR